MPLSHYRYHYSCYRRLCRRSKHCYFHLHRCSRRPAPLPASTVTVSNPGIRYSYGTGMKGREPIKSFYHDCCYSVISRLSAMILVTIFFAALLAVVPPISADALQMKFDHRVFNASARSARDLAVCTKGGPACDLTCRKTGICIATGDNFAFRETSNCGAGFCNPSGTTATCEATSTNCVPNSEEIGCDTTGVFPDPYNCHSVLNCLEGKVANSIAICTDDLAYDSCTAYCDVVLPTLQCKSQDPLCTNIGDYGNLPGNDRLYYYCVQDEDGWVHPVVGRCPRGYFDKETFSCTESETAGCVL